MARGIDAASGAIALASGGAACSIDPSTTRAAFLASPLGAKASPLVMNEPWCSWRLAAASRLGGLPFFVGIYFNGEALWAVQLTLDDPRFGTSWDDWSEGKERARDAAHHAWLVAQLGPLPHAGADGLRRYAWGRVSAGFDSRSGGSSIWIRYGAE